MPAPGHRVRSCHRKLWNDDPWTELRGCSKWLWGPLGMMFCGKVPKNILTGSLQFGGILHSVKIMDKNQKPKKITNSWRRILENDLQQGASRTIEPGLHRRISFKVSLGGHRRISLKYHRIGNYRDSCSSWKLLWWFPDQQLHQPKKQMV